MSTQSKEKSPSGDAQREDDMQYGVVGMSLEELEEK